MLDSPSLPLIDRQGGRGDLIFLFTGYNISRPIWGETKESPSLLFNSSEGKSWKGRIACPWGGTGSEYAAIIFLFPSTRARATSRSDGSLCEFLAICYRQTNKCRCTGVVNRENKKREEYGPHWHDHLIYTFQQLGDCLGRGAFGSVFRGLNWMTGETVAVKQIQLGNIPKSELGEIMSEIELLKNLKVRWTLCLMNWMIMRGCECRCLIRGFSFEQHPNIVKYKGSEKTKEHLNIILE